MASPSPCELNDGSDMEFCTPSAPEQSTNDYDYDNYFDYYDHDDDVDDSDAELGLIEHRPTSGVEDYIHDILDAYRRTENLRLPADDYLAANKEIDEGMRWDLSNWMIKRHHSIRLRPEILYLSFHIVDRYLSLQADVLATELRLVGATALFMASKYHRHNAPHPREFACFSSFHRSMETVMIEKEMAILQKLDWNLNAPTPYEFLTMFLKAGADCDEEMQFAAFFFGELGLMDYAAVARPPSLRAASALYVARCTLGRTPLWPDELVQETKYSELQLLESSERLVRIHGLVSEDAEKGNKLKAVYKKYAAMDRKAVALQPAASPLIQSRKAAHAPPCVELLDVAPSAFAAPGNACPNHRRLQLTKWLMSLCLGRKRN